MNYKETLDFLYSCLPVFEQTGLNAYKPGLERMYEMDSYFDHPHRNYGTIHVAGTNGKGSTSHTIAAILQAAGYHVGLFTSPHLLDFDERIRVDGIPIHHDFVSNWTALHYKNISHIRPSFFELATMMALDYFAHLKVDIAVIEVGLGGRLDSTNIITPQLSIITNISRDHTHLLGDTLPIIASEKAGIIKSNVPCVIGECPDENVKEVFLQQAKSKKSQLFFASEELHWTTIESKEETLIYETKKYGTIISQLTGLCQPHNTATILTAIDQLRKLYTLSPEHIKTGFANVCQMTGLMGRWQQLSSSPLIYGDTGHNEACFRYIVPKLRSLLAMYGGLHFIFGMMKDKEIEAVLEQLPREVSYHITQADTPRSLPINEMKQKMDNYNLCSKTYSSTDEALKCVLHKVSHDCYPIFIGGSNFIVAEAIRFLAKENIIKRK